MRQPLSPLPRRRAGHALFPCLVLFGAPATTALLPVGGVRWTTSRACARCAALAQRQPAPVRMEHAPSDSLISAARTISIAAAIFFFVRSFLVEPYFIPSSSMAPTLNRNDHIAVEKFSKYLSPPHRGDIFVFTPPAAFFVQAWAQTSRAFSPHPPPSSITAARRRRTSRSCSSSSMLIKKPGSQRQALPSGWPLGLPG